MFSIRIFSVDHYMSSPILGLDPTYSQFRGKEVKQVPILRIFGANQTGHKTCLHVHGVLPYLHIPHDETSLESTEKLCYRVAASLDKAINILMGQSDSSTQHVFDVTPVAGIPLYGYHNQKHQFLKIRFFNPFTVKKAATLFQNGTILDRIYQPHDAHINYELQFMIDFNLHGMNNINLSDIKYRIDEQTDSSIIDDIPSQQVLNKNITRISTCKYEIDCVCENILNLQEVTNGKLSANPGIAAIWEEERHRRQLQNKDTQDIAPTPSQLRTKLTETSSEIFFKNRLRDRIESLINSNVSSVPTLNQSIYPSEVSDPSQFLNASIAHLIQNPELSCTLIEKSESIVNENLILSLTQDEKNQPIIDDIYNVLVDLIDEDSILSQHPFNEQAVVLEDEIEQESHDLEQTLIEDNQIFSSNEKRSESIDFESDLINEIFSSNDSFMKHVNVSQLEQNIETDLEQTVLDNYSEDTLIDSEKQYSIFYDDIIEMKKTQLKSTGITFSQFSDDLLDSVIEDEIAKIEKSHDEESIIYSTDSEELIFDGEWKRIPQIDGATKELKEKPKRKRVGRSKKDESDIFREILCEHTGMIYKVDPIVKPKLLKKKITQEKKLKSAVKVLKIEENNVNVEDLTKNISYEPVSFQNMKPNETFTLNMPIIDDPIINIINKKECEVIPQQYDDLLKEFDHYLSQSKYNNATSVTQCEKYEMYPEINTTYTKLNLKSENNNDFIMMPPVDVILKYESDTSIKQITSLQDTEKSAKFSRKNIKNEFIDLDSNQKENCVNCIEPLPVDTFIEIEPVENIETSIKNQSILDRVTDDNYLGQDLSNMFMDNFQNYTFDIQDDLTCIKGLLSEMINAVAPDETYEIYPESSCNLYHEMNAIFSGKTTIIDIQCRFLQNVRECLYKQILNPMQPMDVEYVLKLNRNLEPITIDAYNQNHFPTTKTTVIDKEKFLKSSIYDKSIGITDKHSVFCKNGKIIIKENLSENISQEFPRSKSCFEFYDNWKNVKFNIIEKCPWSSTKDISQNKVRKVRSLPAIVSSKSFDSKLREFITNDDNAFNIKNKPSKKTTTNHSKEKQSIKHKKNKKPEILKSDTISKINSREIQNSLNSEALATNCMNKNLDEIPFEKIQLKSTTNIRRYKDIKNEEKYIKIQTKYDSLKINSIGAEEIKIEDKTFEKIDDKTFEKNNDKTFEKIDTTREKIDDKTFEKNNDKTFEKIDTTRQKIDDKTFEKVDDKTFDKTDDKTFKKHRKIDDKIPSQNIVANKIDSNIKQPNLDINIFQKFESKNIEETKLNSNKNLKIYDKTFEKVESKTDYEKIDNNVICKIPLVNLPRYVLENITVDMSSDRQFREISQIHNTSNNLQQTIPSNSDIIKNINDNVKKFPKVSDKTKYENKNNAKSSQINIIPNLFSNESCNENNLTRNIGLPNDTTPKSSTFTKTQKCYPNGKSQISLKNYIKVTKFVSSKKLIALKQSRQTGMIFKRKRNIQQKLLLQQKIRKHFQMESNNNGSFTKETTDLETFISHRVIKKKENNKFIISVLNNNNDEKYNLPKKTLNERWNDPILVGLLNFENHTSTKPSNSKSNDIKNELLRHSLDLNDDEEGFVKTYPIAQSSPIKSTNENNNSKLESNENSTGTVLTRDGKKLKKNSLHNHQNNLQNVETNVQEKNEEQENQLNFKQSLSENVGNFFTPPTVDTVYPEQSMEKIEIPLENKKETYAPKILQPIIKKKASRKSLKKLTDNNDYCTNVSENAKRSVHSKKKLNLEIKNKNIKNQLALNEQNKINTVEEEFMKELNLKKDVSENKDNSNTLLPVDSVSNTTLYLSNSITKEDSIAISKKSFGNKQTKLNSRRKIKSVELNSRQNIPENIKNCNMLYNLVQSMEKSETPLENPNISKNAPPILRSKKKPKNKICFMENLDINNTIDNQILLNKENNIDKVEEFLSPIDIVSNVTSNHSNSITKEDSIEISKKSSGRKRTKLNSRGKIKSIELNSRQNIPENNKNCNILYNLVQSMEKSKTPLGNPNISKNAPPILRSKKKPKNKTFFMENLNINKIIDSQILLNNENKIVKVEECLSPVDIVLNTTVDHPNSIKKEISISLDKEQPTSIKSSKSKQKTLKSRKKIKSAALNPPRQIKSVELNSRQNKTENSENFNIFSPDMILNPLTGNPNELMEKIEIPLETPKEKHNLEFLQPCVKGTRKLKDVKVFVENLGLNENSENQMVLSEEKKIYNINESIKEWNLKQNVSENNDNSDTKPSVDKVLNIISDYSNPLIKETSLSLEKEQSTKVKSSKRKQRKRKSLYSKRRKPKKKSVKINLEENIPENINDSIVYPPDKIILKPIIPVENNQKENHEILHPLMEKKISSKKSPDKLTNEKEISNGKEVFVENLEKIKNIENQMMLNDGKNSMEQVSTRQRPVRRAKLNAYSSRTSSMLAQNSRVSVCKQAGETKSINYHSTSTPNHIETISIEIQDQINKLSTSTPNLKKSQEKKMDDPPYNLRKYQKIPGIDGTFDLSLSLDYYLTDSSDDDNSLLMTDDIIFVDGLNHKKTIRDKYNLRECSVILSKCDDNVQVTKSNKRKLRTKSKELTPIVIPQSNKKCRYTPLNIVLTKSPTSRYSKGNDQRERKIKSARKRLKLNFDDQQSFPNDTTEELQSMEERSKENFQSTSEIEESLPQIGGTGEFTVQDLEPQSLESSKIRENIKPDQSEETIIIIDKNIIDNLQKNNKKNNNVIQNACDNSSDLVYNSISDKNRRRSLRNRTLLSETKKNIEKHSTHILKTSTPIGKTDPKITFNLNSTYIEENKGCTLSPKSSKKINLINVSQVPLENEIPASMEQIKNSSPESESDDSIIIPNPTEINREYISPSPEHEIKLLISPRKSQKNYTNALEYDVKNKFFPQPGCSTVEEDNSSSEIHLGEKTRNVYQDDSSQSVHSENREKLSQTQVSECDVESFYDVTFGDCTKFDEDEASSNPKSSSSFHCAQNNNDFDQKPSQSTEIQLSGLSFQSDSTLTQNANKKLNTLNLSTIEFEKGETRLTNGCVILMPKFNPPSYDDIKNSLAEYNIPELQYENPFYSVPTDATGRIEIGHKILKIPTKCVQDLPEFTSNLEFDPLNVWRRRKIDNMQVQSLSSLATNREVLITPNCKPPSYKDIEVWLRAKNQLKKAKPKQDENIKIKIRIPSSPGGGNSDSDDSDSLTLSPCTPKNESIQIPTGSIVNTPESAQMPTIQTPTGNFVNTPKSTQIRQSPSMIHKSTKHILKNKRVKVALSKSFKKSQDNDLLDPSVANLLNDPQFRKDLNSPLSNSSCLITGVTLNNTHGFKVPLENFQDVKTMVKHQYLTTIILELHIKNRQDFKPNPQLDPIVAIFYSIYNDVPANFELPQSETGIICISPNNFLIGTCTNDIKIAYVESELQLFDTLIELFRKWDPDILAGYEICRLSWGYLLERGFHLQLNLPKRLSRIPESRANTRIDENGKMSDIHFTGRLFLEIWRLMRHEIDLYSYSFENIVFHILHERIPKHSFKNLSVWFESTCNRYITVQYYLKRVTGVLSILDQLDFIGRTSELARLFGIQFYEVLSRGSQFRVESMMLRLTKPLNYIPVTPSVTQRAKMKAPEFLPLIMEPDSRLYTDPIIVLDFQSLYPSMIIAYNYCFSTCLGRVSELGPSHPFDFGATQLRVNPKLVETYLNNNKLNISPCGVAYVNDSVRQGILPRMLKEILDCRLMVKKSLKENKDDATLKRVLNSRQLGLKLIANVTYGYTAANFSGRMPCCELADSVVSKGRETLERAIQMVEKNEKWGAKVVYGDTDSLFVMTPGRSRKDAFQIGKEIAEAVTNDNPTPVKLKLEKIYQPCILQTKKRYVGYMYESPDQEEPVYNAKGIETVRRDGCPAVAKILEKTLRMLFETKDMSIVKQYVCRQFSKIITGRINLQDLIFAREFRGLNGYRPGAMVPALELAKRYKMQDPKSEPLRSERVPYVIASGAPGTTLVRLAKGPHELLADPALKPHIQYYITKVIIPPLNRCLSLCGVDVHAWYKDLPRKYKLYFPTADTLSKDAKKSTIAQHFATASCVSCGVQTRDVICSSCVDDPQKTVIVLQEKLRKWERNLDNIKKICSSCCGRSEETQCTSLDCPVLYRLTQSQRDCEQAPFVRNALFSKILIDVQSSSSSTDNEDTNSAIEELF